MLHFFSDPIAISILMPLYTYRTTHFSNLVQKVARMSKMVKLGTFIDSQKVQLCSM